LLREPRGLERRDDERLLEIDRGTWAGRTKQEIARTEPQLWAQSQAMGGALNPPDAETVHQVCQRVRLGLDAAANLACGEQVAVVAHMWVLRAAAALVLGLEPSQLARIQVPTGGLIVLDWVPGGPDPVGRSRVVGLCADSLPPAP
jgi:broad specificity phosphatase PhoE